MGRGLKSLVWVLLLIGLSTSLLVGCSQSKKEAPKADQATEAATTEESGGSEESGSDEGGEAAAPDLFKNIPSEEVEIPAADHVKLTGQLFDPSQKVSTDSEGEKTPAKEEEKPVVAGKKYPLIILLHSLDSNRRDWQLLPADLMKKGYAVFAMDMRGHGKSTQTEQEGEHVSWREFSKDDWKKMPQDVDQVLKFFKASTDYPQVDVSRVALVGASLGANVAILEANHTPKTVKAIVLFSPGLDYKGLTTSDAMINYPNAVFIAASQKDPTVYESADKLYRWALGPKAIRIYRNIGRGEEMLTNQPSLKQEIIQWLLLKLPPIAEKATPIASADASAEEN